MRRMDKTVEFRRVRDCYQGVDERRHLGFILESGILGR